MSDMTKYPFERKFKILRKVEGTKTFEEREETWLQLGEMDASGNLPKSLVESKPTGRVFKLTRKVADESSYAKPEAKEVFFYLSPDDWCWEYYEQVSGPPFEGSTLPIGVSKKTIEDIA